MVSASLVRFRPVSTITRHGGRVGTLTPVCVGGSSSVRSLPRNPRQQELAQKLEDPNCKVVVATGPAGTGKTFLSCAFAMNALRNGDVKRIIMTRPAVGLQGEEHGFLPGDLDQKMSPWIVPIMDNLTEFVLARDIKRLKHAGSIEICPLSHIRGRTFHDCWIIADECQNCTPNQLKSLLTRPGRNTKVVMTGDLEQSDLADSGTNGLEDFLLRLKESHFLENAEEIHRMIHHVEFLHADVERSELVRHVLTLYGL